MVWLVNLKLRGSKPLIVQGATQIPTSRQILEDLQSADSSDVVFTNPPTGTTDNEGTV